MRYMLFHAHGVQITDFFFKKKKETHTRSIIWEGVGARPISRYCSIVNAGDTEKKPSIL